MGRFLKLGALVAALVLFGTYLFGATRAGASKIPTSSRVNTEELYAQNCARCHGADGQGDTPLGQTYGTPDFTSARWWQEHGKSNREMIAIVANGKGGMPAFKRKLNQSEIKALVAYVRKFRS
ncbi:MAG TPA: cytochrome c [Pyrinomonadaceae bacterium]|nr:cytochrome c [Pyrinomonadaceae bacterium]